MRSVRRFAVICVALIAATPADACAQSADSSSLVGATLVELSADAWLYPGPSHSMSISGTAQRFVSEHWQLGVSPVLSVSSSPSGSSVGVSLGGIVNYVIGTGRVRGSLGAFGSGSRSSAGTRGGVIGAQVGVLYFLAPATALRAELRSTQWNLGIDATLDAYVTLDPYLGAPRSGPAHLPTLGAVDAALFADVGLDGGRARQLDVMLAPFITSWAQVGGAYDRISVPINGGWPGSQRYNGFARLYAPISPGVMPFVEGFMASTNTSFGSHGPVSYGAVGGVRHYFNPGVALDIGLSWRGYEPVSQAGAMFHPKNELTLHAGMVSELHAR